MKKIIFKTTILLIFILLIFLSYLSVVGIKTNKLNNQISDQIKNLNKDLEIELQDVNIILDPFKFKFNLKTLGTNLNYKKKTIELERIKSSISIKSLINNEFSLKELDISTKSIEIKKMISFIRALNGDPRLFIAEKFIKKGFLITDINLEFDENGKIKKNYKIDGYIKDGRIKILSKYDISNINFIFNITKDKLQFNEFRLSLNNKKFSILNLQAKKTKEEFFVSGKLLNKKIMVEKNDIKNFFNNINDNFRIEKIDFSSENEFSFNLDKGFKLRNLKVNSKIEINDLFLNNNTDLNYIFPDLKNEINLSNHKINLKYDKKSIKIEGSGNFLNENDKINYSLIRKDENTKFDTSLKILKNSFRIDFLNFEKKTKSELEINVKGTKDKKNNYKFEKISLIEDDNKILIKDLLFQDNKTIKKIKKINLDYKDIENKKNEISIIRKNKFYLLSGNSININKLLEKLLNSKEQNQKIFEGTNKIEININKVYLDEINEIENLNGYFILKNNDIIEANLKSQFSNKEFIKFTISTKTNEKITTLFSAKAKPLVNRYKFIKGFDDGSLDFYSIKKGGNSISTLKIYDFKLKELPALTKILTLASLQGIADLLSGEGIRFNEFEMKFNNKKNLMTIDEIYAIGPAISILMSGYIESERLISLRGTLVPATTLNKTIGSIPILGDILVGKKVGEGVFGVSFKIKGPPKKLETTVNPIKTLTPRFITRTLEKIKKN